MSKSSKSKIDDLSDVNFNFIGADMDMKLIDSVINKEKEETKETVSNKSKEKPKSIPSTKIKEKKVKNLDAIIPEKTKAVEKGNDVLINLDLEKYNDENKRKQVLILPEIYTRLNAFKSEMYIKNKMRIENVDFVNKVLDQVLKYYGH